MIARLQERDTNMRKILLFGVIAILVITLYACSLTSSPSTNNNTINGVAGNLPSISLTVQAPSAIYNAVGQTITYTYVVTNIGTPAVTGPVTIVDDKVGVICPEVNTVGNKDNNLDSQESLTCSSTYTITQADLNARSVTSTATAIAQ